MTQTQCIAIRLKSGAIDWSWKADYSQLKLRDQIAQTALFFTREGTPKEEIQKLAEQAIATENQRWASAGTLPDDMD